jgi:hypothetical protein
VDVEATTMSYSAPGSKQQHPSIAKCRQKPLLAPVAITREFENLADSPCKQLYVEARPNPFPLKEK